MLLPDFCALAQMFFCFPNTYKVVLGIGTQSWQDKVGSCTQSVLG